MSEETVDVLVVDDDREFIEDFKLLIPESIHCLPAASIPDAKAVLEQNDVGLVFLDIDLGTGSDGLDFLRVIKQESPYLPVVMITADDRVETVVQAMQLGASDYIGKSPDLSKLRISIERAVQQNRLQQHLDLLQSELAAHVGDLVGNSPAITKVKAEIARLAKVPSNVLITGRSGTGKELVARSIHRLSHHAAQPFIAVNCAALSRELVESELFGHEKGAFTGAIGRRIGKFEVTGSGTLFLDEITEIPLGVQAKLLRVLQEREFERVGGNRSIAFRGRILASSNRNIEGAIKENRLREDLYYRLNVTRVHIPPLAERKADIEPLANYFLLLRSRDMKRRPPVLSESSLRLLHSHHWPGNVRELANCIENALVHCDQGVIEPSHLDQLLVSGSEAFDSYDEAKRHFLIKFQRDYISAALAKNDGNVSRTAQALGLSRQGLAKMMESCGLS